MRILKIVFLLSVCGCPQALSLAITDILEVANVSKVVVIDVLRIFEIIDSIGPDLKDDILIQTFKEYNSKIDMLYAQLEGKGSQLLYGIVVHTHIQSQLKFKLLEVSNYINFIELKYKDMVTLLNMTDNCALEAFARSIVSHSHRSLESVLDIIHTVIAPKEDGVPSVFHIVHNITKEPGNELFCNMQTSTQQLYLYLYNTLALTELKGFLLTGFSYMHLQLHNKGKFAKEMKAARERYKNRTATTLKLTIEAVKVADQDLWKCDPHKQVKNKTYIEITELLQGHIELEENLNDQQSCNMACHHFNDTVSNNCDDYGGQHKFCTKNRQCKGKLINCHFIADATVCHADAGTNRRYEYIEQAGAVLGLKKECAHNTSLKGWLRGMAKCDYCMCLCDEQGVNSDRFISLRNSLSDMDSNMVVTGLRFVKKNRIIHLQIQQGKLLPRYEIDLTTVHWKPIDDFRIDGGGVLNGVNERDYHTLTWDQRNFDLDDLVTEEGELVTGVGFLMFPHLQLRILVTPFNFTNGKWLDGTQWRINDINNRKKLNLDNKDIPIRSPDHSLPLSQSGMYLEFMPTDVSKDLAQTTVPFFDAQAVESAKPVPLCGAGVLYKGSKNFGGFIYPKITTYDYSRLFLNAHDDTLELNNTKLTILI